MSDTFVPDAQAGAPADGNSGVATEHQPVQAENTAGSAAADTADDAGADAQGQRPNGVQKRIGELTANWRQAERDRDHWREMAMRAAQGGQPQQQPPAHQAAQQDPLAAIVAQHVGPAPKPEDFPAGEFDPAFRQAEQQWLRRSAATEAEIRMAQRLQMAQAAAAEQQVRQSFTQQVAKVAQSAPDAVEAIGSLGNRLPDPVANMLAEAGADVAYHVATNPEAEARIRQARTPAAVAREIGRIEARLEAASRPAAVQPTSAPPPPSRGVRGGGSSVPDWNSMSPEAFAAMRNQQEFGKR